MIAAAVEWVSAVGTLFAVGVALWVAWREGQWRRHDDRRQAYSRAREVREATDELRSFELRSLGYFRILNGLNSDAVRDVVVVGVLENGEERNAGAIDRIGPDEIEELQVDLAGQPRQWMPGEIQHRNVEFVAVRFDFVDESGRSWRRLSEPDEVFLRCRDRFGRLRWRRADGACFRDPRPRIPPWDGPVPTEPWPPDPG
ncbi:hypothetical protein [Ilumatobacter sp.]|uniref:hypothetical protein n=1 Tax=Ilumatobacter sp. TaxID=1967498 RepID=UPI003B52BDC2